MTSNSTDGRRTQDSSLSTTAETTMLCLFCVEPMNDSGTNTVHRSCCGHELCQGCFYHHIMSILQQDEFGHFRNLACPFGCGTALLDAEVRASFANYHGSRGIFRWLRWLCSAFLSLCFYPYHWRWWNIRVTHQERRDLDRYAAWSLQRGLADLRKKEDDTIILNCPGTDCSFQWIVADPQHRRDKQRHEARSYWLWYTPYRVPERTPENFVFHPNSFARLSLLPYNADVRRMVCPACHTVFCGLCRNPWVFGTADHSYRACRSYRRLPAIRNEPNLEDRFALAGFGRTCPGCTRRTERISGCNHMTCPCGTEWCYACGKRWNPSHYSCADGGGASPCVIL